MKATSGRSCGDSAGARNARSARRASATKRRSALGSARPGRALKKSPPRRPHVGLHRRKRIESEAASLPQLGATRPDARPAVQLQLAEAFRLSGADAAPLLLPALSGRDRPSRGDRLSQSAAASHRPTVADHLGSIAGPPQPPENQGLPSAGPASMRPVKTASQARMGRWSGSTPIEKTPLGGSGCGFF